MCRGDWLRLGRLVRGVLADVSARGFPAESMKNSGMVAIEEATDLRQGPTQCILDDEHRFLSRTDNVSATGRAKDVLGSGPVLDGDAGDDGPDKRDDALFRSPSPQNQDGDLASGDGGEIGKSLFVVDVNAPLGSRRFLRLRRLRSGFLRLDGLGEPRSEQASLDGPVMGFEVGF
jgi:hypothetical protein